jgi:hypothetical protein
LVQSRSGLGGESCLFERETVSGAERFDFFDGSRPLLAQDPATGGRDQQVLFDADATEIPVGFHSIVVDELEELSLALPALDEFGNEVDAWLDGQDEARLQGTPQPKRFEPVLLGSPS